MNWLFLIKYIIRNFQNTEMIMFVLCILIMFFIFISRILTKSLVFIQICKPGGGYANLSYVQMTGKKFRPQL